MPAPDSEMVRIMIAHRRCPNRNRHMLLECRCEQAGIRQRLVEVAGSRLPCPFSANRHVEARADFATASRIDSWLAVRAKSMRLNPWGCRVPFW